MGRRRGLIDSNVLVAAAGSRHQHFEASAALIGQAAADSYATARHCLAEFYNVTTGRYIPEADPLPPEGAWESLEAFTDVLEVLELNGSQHLEAIRRFAALGGRGARVYDFLIGQVAVVNAIPLVVTWNVKHFAPLFPQLRVATPAVLLKESQ